MPDRTYIVTFDPSDPSADVDALREFVKNGDMIKAWWNHVPSVFLISTDADVGRLSREIKRYTHDARLLVMAVDPAGSEGWLPERSWQWIRRRSTPSAAAAALAKMSAHGDGGGA